MLPIKRSKTASNSNQPIGKYTDKTAYDFQFIAMDGSIFPLSQFQGKVMLIVNTASECGFTPQYKALQELWEEYKDLGLTIIATPCNDFGNQEPAADNDVFQFCRRSFNITFPLMRKVTVVGPRAHLFYKWAEEQVGFAGHPRWNFHKYLIGPKGELVNWFAPFTDPMSKKVRKAIEKVLARAIE